MDLQLSKRGFFAWSSTQTDVESKLGYTSKSGDALIQTDKDIARLAANSDARLWVGRGGKALGALGVGLTAYELNEANIADGRTFGVNTQRAASGAVGGFAGAWAGAEAGALVGGAGGSVVPVVGNVAGAIGGGIIGGLIGEFGGDYAARHAYDGVRGK